jgi:hypothetical protein
VSPIVEIPDAHASRTPIWNKKKRHPADGRRRRAERPLFDLKTAKQFMQTMLHA